MARPKQFGYRKWMPHNLDVLKKKCRFQVLTVSQPELVAMLKAVAEKVVNFVKVPDGLKFSVPV